MRIIQDTDFAPPIPRYDFDSWLSGKTVLISSGEDFDCAVESMAIYLRRKARERGLNITLHTDRLTEQITFRSYTDDEKRPEIPKPMLLATTNQPLPDSYYCQVCNRQLNANQESTGRRLCATHETEQEAHGLPDR